MFKPRSMLTVVLVAVIAVLAIAPAAALADPLQPANAWPVSMRAGPPPAGGVCWYRVHWGDTLANIAWAHFTSATYLQGLNGLRNANRIFAGQMLRVPCQSR